MACRRGVRSTRERARELAPRRTSRQRSLTLAVLRGLTGLLETGLLALDRTVVALEEAGLLQGATVVVDVRLVQRTGDTETERTGLTGDAAAGDAGDDVVAASSSSTLKGSLTSCWCTLFGK